MNKERMLKLADFLDTLKPERFKLDAWIENYQIDLEGSLTNQDLIENCGTCGCIAGWAVLLYGNAFQPSVATQARKLLELTQEEADALFIDRWVTDPDDDCGFDVLPKEAAVYIRQLVDAA